MSTLIALCWGGICRIGEVLAAFREDLILPQDVMYTSNTIYLKIREPKTRFKAARHQVARLDYEDLVDLIAAVIGSVDKSRLLWPHSGQLLRTRFKQLLAGVGLPTDHRDGRRPLDLGSLRAGGICFSSRRTLRSFSAGGGGLLRER